MLIFDLDIENGFRVNLDGRILLTSNPFSAIM